MKKIKITLPITALLTTVIFTLSISAFTIPSAKTTKSDTHRADFFFKFTGTPGQEDDETQWNQITSTEYDLLGCSGAHDGCELKTTSIQTINGSNYPSQVDIDPNSPAGHKDPITSTSSGVTEVRNMTNL